MTIGIMMSIKGQLNMYLAYFQSITVDNIIERNIGTMYRN